MFTLLVMLDILVDHRLFSYLNDFISLTRQVVIHLFTSLLRVACLVDHCGQRQRKCMPGEGHGENGMEVYNNKFNIRKEQCRIYHSIIHLKERYK